MAEIYPSYGYILWTGEYTETPDTAVIRTDMESGIPKQARIRSLSSHKRPLTYRYTKDELASWKRWYRTRIDRGSPFFFWTDPVDGVAKQARIVNGEVDYSAVTSTLSHWNVSFTLETYE